MTHNCQTQKIVRINGRAFQTCDCENARMLLVCPTCESAKCGNHAACERKTRDAHKRFTAFCDMWLTLGVLIFIAHYRHLGRRPTGQELFRLSRSAYLIYKKLVPPVTHHRSHKEAA